MMDSHLLRKASYRLPALADLAVLRFNTRGTSSERGTSGGAFGGGGPERFDVDAGIEFCVAARLPALWPLGWAFGTGLALMWGNRPPADGASLASPALRGAGRTALYARAATGAPRSPT